MHMYARYKLCKIKHVVSRTSTDNGYDNDDNIR